MAQAHLSGHSPDWQRIFPDTPAVELPTYAFEHQQYWLHTPRAAAGDPAALGVEAARHALLGATTEISSTRGWMFTGRLALEDHPWIADHAVYDTVLLPGTAYLDLALHAAGRTDTGRVEELMLEAPLVLTADRPVQLQIGITEADTGTGHRTLTLHSRTEHADWIRHATATLTAEDSGVAANDWAAQWPPAGAAPLDLTGVYDRLAERGYEYGPALRGLRTVWRAGRTTYAEVTLPEDTDIAGYGLHPALLDAALHPLLLPEEGDTPAAGVQLPFTWTGAQLHATGATTLRVRIDRTGSDTIELTVADPAGATVLAAESLTVRAVDAGKLSAGARAATAGYELNWELLPAAATPPESLTIRTLPALDPEILRESADTAPQVLVVPAAGPDGEIPAATHALTARALRFVQVFLAEPAFESTRLVITTRGAVAAGVGEAVGDLPAAALWGLVRTAQTENPDRIVLLDLGAGGAADPELVAEAVASGEPQLAARPDGLHRLRLIAVGAPALTEPDTGPWRLDITRSGTIDNLTLATHPEAAAPLRPGQVRIAVRASGINFRDVLITLGVYPGHGTIGSEAAGVVLETAPDVTSLKAGDRVMGLAASAAAPITVVDHRWLVPMPTGWTYAQAAAVPVVFLTAYYGLRDLATVRTGEKILIHAAAGGVGQAAIQLARHWGLDVYATASPGKWGVLRAAGLSDERIANSRTLEFADRFAAAVPDGIDIVLNSLAGEFVDASLRLLPSNAGRFIEMGKTDIRDADEIAQLFPGVHYRAFDLIEAGPDRHREMLTDLRELFERGVLTPLPLYATDIHHAPEAFRHLQQGRNIGKHVLTVPTALDPDGSVLITGGTGTLGGLIARFVVREWGIRDLVLVSRQGPGAAGAGELCEELTGLGARVQVVACDVGDEAVVRELVAGVPRLTAVVHTAGVLEDSVVSAMSVEQLDRVLVPKVDAGWWLHRATEGLDLSAFVLFSSASGVLGNSGQANYAAANSFLDGLAGFRRARGLVASSLSWGFWEESSAMTGALTERDIDRIRRSGLTPITNEVGLALFDAALAGGRAHTVSTRLERSALRELADQGTLPRIFSGLLTSPARTAATSGNRVAATVTDRLASLPVAERRDALVDMLTEQVAAILGHDSAQAIAPHQAFKDLGFDSLTAVELRNRLKAVTGLRLPATLIFDYPTPDTLADHLHSELYAVAEAPAQPVVPGTRVDATTEPIAIVAMACRYPGGVDSPEELWRLLVDEQDAIGTFPSNRGWDIAGIYHPDPEHAGTTYATTGGFVTEAADFDPAFFGINPREALAMDPQQRMLLETSWEVLERAAIPPNTLRGTPIGVFTGVITQQYGPSTTTAASNGAHDVEGYLLTGKTGSVASGRIAYTLGFEGPAVSIDTACSSSLVAIHLAAQSLRNGECSMALAGGVTVNTSPDVFIDFARQRVLAFDGRCKAFAAGADGTGFAEGAGMLLLERQSDAIANGHPILAVIRGSATNQDGASNGLSAPNGPSQERVIRQALANAGVSADGVDAVEAHGTGTALGDPIEAQALLATYGRDRDPRTPLWLGSLKSNIGHSQAAAGVGGVIKMVQAMRHGVLPRTLHIDEPTPHVDWSEGTVALLTRARDWSVEGDRPRRAGVSSFGISGTNAHVILEQAPVYSGAEPEPEPQPVALPLVVSAKSARGVAAQAARLRAFLAEDPARSLRDVAYSLVQGRTQFEYRAAVVAADRDEAITALDALTTQTPTAGVLPVTGPLPARSGGLVFVFPGQGWQWAAMARDLLATEPVFAEQLRACAAALTPFVDWDLHEVLTTDAGAASLTRMEVLQPTLWAVMIGLAALWRARGIHPDAVVGQSQGEIAAAYVSGVLSLEDSARIVTLRAQAALPLLETGTLASVAAPAEEITDRLTGRPGMYVAGMIGPAATVIAGPIDAVTEFVSVCEADGYRARVLPATFASHSPHVESIRGRVLDDLAATAPGAGAIPFYSTVTGGLIGGATLDAAYWYRNLAEPVRLRDTVRALSEAGHTLFIEVSANPVLTAPLTDTLAETGRNAVAIGTLQRDDGGSARFTAAVAEAHLHGHSPDWDAVIPAGRVIDLPTYAFARERFWLDAPTTHGDPVSLGLTDANHPILGAAVELPGEQGRVLTAMLTATAKPWIAGHRILGTVLLPGSAYLDLALHAAADTDTPQIEELTVQAPLVLEPGVRCHLQVRVRELDGQTGRRAVTVYSRPVGDDIRENLEWTLHASATLVAATADSGRRGAGLPGTVPPASAVPVDLAELRERALGLGVEYQPAFDNLRAAWRDGDDIYAEIAVPDAAGHRIHPALLDAALLVALFDAEPGQERAEIRMPFSWNGVRQRAAARGLIRARIGAIGDGEVSLRLDDSHGVPVAEVDALALRAVSPQQLASARAAGQRSIYQLDWVSAARSEQTPTIGVWAVDSASGLSEALVAAGSEVLSFHDRPVFDADFLAPDVVLLAAAAAPDTDVRTAAGELARGVLEWIAELLDEPLLDDSRLLVVTRGAVPVHEGEIVSDVAAATVWGAVRGLQVRYPGRVVLIDLDTADPSADLLQAVAGGDEPQLALRGGEWFVPRLTRAPVGDGPGVAFDPDGTVLLTGGDAPRGAATARHLVTRYGVRRLLLCGGDDELRRELIAAGAQVEIVEVDLCESAGVRAMVDAVDSRHPLTAIFHTFRAETPEATVAAAWQLHGATAELDLAAFVLYSTTAGVLGDPNQSGVAAADAFLDALAARRRAAGRHAVSLAWGQWAAEGTDLAALRAGGPGLGLMPSAEALGLLDAALLVDRAAVVPARVNLGVYQRDREFGTIPAVLRDLVGHGIADSGDVANLTRELAGLDAAEQSAVILGTVRTQIAEVLGHADSDDIDAERPLKDLGFDSLTAVQLRNRLSAVTGLRLPATLIFDYPTIDAIVGYVRTRITPDTPAGDGPALEGLARIEADLLARPAGDPLRASFATRLEALLRRLGDEPDGAGEVFEPATDDELFGALDRELGSFTSSSVPPASGR
ncbi:SDR family NAD(P)-dependent oxidoreductase [Nocardia sp. SYP-A9097]|uniref:SDR family NAD(P)-dependent oxidoreductase n=1 Tax=Nocardia sp. SYP-A9097 TaxID=2663237 RepID=UPI0035C8E1C1